MFTLIFGQASAAPSPDPSLWTQFGPFAIVFILMAGLILDQRATIKSQAREITEGRKQIVEDVVPLAVRMVDVLRDVAHSTGRGQ